MIVITISECPPSLRGDLTKWLFEINVGVYVGQVSVRVRDELWGRILENVKVGRVTMVYQANNEQRIAFRVHNSEWRPIDFDGLTLMLRPVESFGGRPSSLRPGFSRAAHRQIARRIQQAESKKAKEERKDVRSGADAAEERDDMADIHGESIKLECHSVSNETQDHLNDVYAYKDMRRSSKTPIDMRHLFEKDNEKNSSAQKDMNLKKDDNVKKLNESKYLLNSYVVIDLETTGLNEHDHEIIELGAIRVVNGQIEDKYQCLVQTEFGIPEFIEKLTGITNELIDEQGIPLDMALDQFMSFIGNHILVGHNVSFDIKFINAALEKLEQPLLKNRSRCTLEMARTILPHLKSRKLKAMLEYFSIESDEEHRSLSDCISVYRLYEKFCAMMRHH